MPSTHKISISGLISKKNNIWVAEIPVLKICSHALTPAKCFESLSRNISQLIWSKTIKLKVRLSDKGVFYISSSDTEIFLEFIKARIRKSHDHAEVMERLKDYVFEEI